MYQSMYIILNYGLNAYKHIFYFGIWERHYFYFVDGTGFSNGMPVVVFIRSYQSEQV